MLPSGNASDGDAAADPARPGNVGEPDLPIHIPEATLVEDQVGLVVEATLIEDEAPLAQNDGPLYEAIPVREWKLRHKALAGVSLLVVAAVLVFIGVRVSRINATGTPPPSDSNSTAPKSNSTDYTLEYFADALDRLCTKDESKRPDEDSGANFYQTIADCCENEFWHLRDNECLMNSFGMTHAPSYAPSDSPSTSDSPSSTPSDVPSSSGVPSASSPPSPVPSTGPTFGPSSIPSMSQSTKLQSSALRLVTSEDVVGSYGSTENVAVQGDTAVIGAPLNDNEKGAAFVFKRDKSAWSQLAKLEAPDGEAGDRFGRSVAIDGDTIIVGADGDDSQKGSVHVFAKINDSWQHQARLESPDRDADDDDASFGFSVGIHKDSVVAGAYFEDSIGYDAGAAYVFVRNETTWALESRLLAPAGDASDYFGVSVGIFDDAIVVGASDEDAGAARSGAAHVYSRTPGGAWEHHAGLSSPDGAYGDRFGWSVGIHGNRVIVGAQWDSSAGVNAGASFVFADDGSAWTLEAKLLAPDGAAGDGFGESVGIFEGTAVVGSSRDDDNGRDSGSARVFELAQGAWSHRAKVLAPDGAANDYFGSSVAVHNGTVIAYSAVSGETFTFSE